MATTQALLGPILLVAGVLLLGAGASGVWYGTAAPRVADAAVAEDDVLDPAADARLDGGAQRLRSAGWIATTAGLLMSVLGGLFFLGGLVRPSPPPPPAP